MRVSLTFDNGPDAAVTPAILDELAARGIGATFFVLGERLTAPGGMDLLVKIRAAGHRVGNHTFSHTTPLGKVDARRAVEEIRTTETLLAETGSRERLFRPFGGRGEIGDHLLNQAAWDYLAERGYTCVLWNVLAREWERPDDWAAATAAEIETHDWSVVVIHDIVTEAPRQLALLLDDLGTRGAEFRQDFPDDCVAMNCGRPTAYPVTIVAAALSSADVPA